ncbi:MAG: 2-alkenal reductase [Gammaproteobacteria bacterium]|nr:MAG: 2-alkenal reductase [Gammaproteobacteria bacterium]
MRQRAGFKYDALGRVLGDCFAAVVGLAFAVAAVNVCAAPVDYTTFKTEDEANNIEIFQQASQAVVYVTNTQLQRDYFSLNIMEIPQGSGSGFIWDTEGHIVTNFHVIQGASKVTITLQDHSEWEAELVGAAPGKDLAVLKIKAPVDQLKPLPIGDSKLLQVGRKVLAIGNPFGLDTTLTVGVVSALGREIDSITQRKIKGVIQTDAAINPGNSGGPLLNSLGQLVGVNTAIYSPSGVSVGIGFAIPVNTVAKIVPQLIQYGRIYRPVLGIETASDSWIARYQVEGVPVVRVQEGSGAEKAGMRGVRKNRRGDLLFGDIIVAVDNVPVGSNDELLTILEKHKIGDIVTVHSNRDRDIHEFRIELLAPE